MWPAKEGWSSSLKKNSADKALKILQGFDPSAQNIGVVTDNSLVTAKTFMGTRRILEKLSGDQLPRIC